MLLKLLMISYTIGNVFGNALDLNSGNIDSILNENDIVFINYYANWCRFSQMLQPIYDEFADKFQKENANTNKRRIVIGKVDCDSEANLAQRYNINKYPTLKLYRNGIMMKREYRGARGVDAFMQYLQEQSVDPIKQINNQYELGQFDFARRPTLIGYFESDSSENYKTYEKLANILRENCHFVSLLGENSAGFRSNGDQIVYRKVTSTYPLSYEDEKYNFELTNYDMLYAWTNEKCTKLVREITFENAEELTEEGLPFLILFHKPDDMESVHTFEREVAKQLVHEKNVINAVYADGYKFSHPLNHLGKTAADLPVLAIDSFRHMYLFNDFKKISDGHSLRQFVSDLNSGKLHREFHNGPDPTEATPVLEQQQETTVDSIHLPKEKEDNRETKQEINSSSPPESAFAKLQPSNKRYTFKDEF